VFLNCSPVVLAVPVKVCSKCGEVKPATREYFQPRPDGRLYGYCRQCDNRRSNIWSAENRERKSDNDRKWREANPERKSASNKAWRGANREYLANYQKDWANANKDRLAVQGRKRVAAWSKENPGKRRAAENRRRARRKQLPDAFTLKDWHTALRYFNDCCAVCGQHLNGMFHGNHQDHWVPLASPDCPGTVPCNIVPLCSDCNLSKSAKPPAEWLIDKFGPRKGKAILRRVEAFLDSRQR
jgi:5-methylcytosine-specific restriction endonuclease McrA